LKPKYELDDEALSDIAFKLNSRRYIQDTSVRAENVAALEAELAAFDGRN
jgi:hypothetical protein